MSEISCESTYMLTETLNSPQSAILCLGTTEDGSYLAAGGTKGMTLWSLNAKKILACPAGYRQRGATTILMWIRHTDEPKEILFFGTQNGYIACWKQVHEGGKDFKEKLSVQIHNPREITGLDFDSTSNRLVVANRNGTIVLFAVESSMVPFGTLSINDYVPTSIAFGQVSRNLAIRDILVFGLGGQIHVLKHNEEKLTVHKTLEVSSMIGHTAVTTAKDVVCIDDPAEGTALYKLQDGARVQTFPIPVRKSHCPQQVAFAEGGKMVISGSDHGVVYIHDRRTGVCMGELTVDREDWVQTLAATRLNGIPCIMAARS
ncbi:WD40-repeat-containing domain protein [Armillaria nabsnona]|nr:WD40-repeat-containing domain protein [Armillaria nabsnona]